jgi:hypothetical protein
MAGRVVGSDPSPAAITRRLNVLTLKDGKKNAKTALAHLALAVTRRKVVDDHRTLGNLARDAVDIPNDLHR